MRILTVSALLIVAAQACYNIPTSKKDISILVTIDGHNQLNITANPYASLRDLRGCIYNDVNFTQFFSDQQGAPIQNIDENSTYIAQAILKQNYYNWTTGVYSIENVVYIQTAPQLLLQTDTYSYQWVNVYDSFSLRQLRQSSTIENYAVFAYGKAPIEWDDELNILISEISQDGLVKTYFKPDNHTNSTEDFYINVDIAGTINITNTVLDNSGNPAYPEFDLGKQGLFNNFTLLIGSFFEENKWVMNSYIDQLNFLGIKCYYTTSEDDFLNMLNYYDVVEAHIFSDNSYDYRANASEYEFTWRVMDFVNSGKGLLLWGNNANYNYHANLVLNVMQSGVDWYGNPISLQISNNFTWGYNFLLPTRKYHNLPGTFQPHKVNTGLNNFYEGQDIPTVQSNSSDVWRKYGDFFVSANSTAGTPLILAKNTTTSGRVIIDCGMSRLQYSAFNGTSGNARLLRNEIVWLAFNDMQQSSNYSLSAPAKNEEEFFGAL